MPYREAHQELSAEDVERQGCASGRHVLASGNDHEVVRKIGDPVPLAGDTPARWCEALRYRPRTFEYSHTAEKQRAPDPFVVPAADAICTEGRLGALFAREGYEHSIGLRGV